MPSIEEIERQILKAVKGCVEDQNRVTFIADFVPCDIVRLNTDYFGQVLSRQPEFMPYLRSLAEKEMVVLKELNHACSVKLGPKAYGRLLMSEDEYQAAQARSQSPSISNVIHGNV